MPRQASRITRQLERFTGRNLARAVVRATRELIKATPRQTGFAQSNWLAGTGPAPTAPIGDKQNIDLTQQSRGLSALRNYRIRDGEIYIVNNCPYIGRLNAGSSTQAPAGFVEEILDRVIGEANRGSIREGF